MRRAAGAGLVFMALLSGASPALSAAGPEKLAACLACHGADGQSQNEAAKGLTDTDLQSIADALAMLPPPKPPDDPADPGRLEQARAAAEQNHCNICHRPDFAGQQTVPRLAGQREDYLLKTLREYKTGERRAYEPIMLEVLQPFDDSQLVEFAYYLSHLR